jgi:hypothetical protein
MFGPFGKRNRISSESLPSQKITRSNWGANKAPAMAPADSDGVSRVFSKELFQGEIGDLLRTAGFSPDMAANIAPTEQTFAAMERRFRDDLARFVDRANRVLGKVGKGVFVKPLLLAPESIWRGEYRNFLCATCRFYPADPTNVFFLAGNAETARKLALPLAGQLSEREAHDFASQVVAKVGEMYEKELNSGKSRPEADAAIHETARGLGVLMTVKLFEKLQYEPEHKLFGNPIYRDFDKLLPADA